MCEWVGYVAGDRKREWITVTMVQVRPSAVCHSPFLLTSPLNTTDKNRFICVRWRGPARPSDRERLHAPLTPTGLRGGGRGSEDRGDVIEGLVREPA